MRHLKLRPSVLALLLVLTSTAFDVRCLAAPVAATTPKITSSTNAPVATSPDEKRLAAAIDAAIAGNAEKSQAVFSGTSFAELNADQKNRFLTSGLKRAYKEALSAYRRKQPDDAVQKLRLFFSLLSFVELDKVVDPDKEPNAFLETWDEALKKADIQKKDYIAPLNDYGFYLQETGHDEPAVRVFRKVVALEPSREVAYLNLADSLWKLGDKDEAAPLYEKYKALMKSENLSSKVPTRVDSTLKAVLSDTGTDKEKDKASGEEVDFGPYMAELQRRIKRNWLPPRNSDDLRIKTIFKLNKMGAISGLKIEKSCGIPAADEAALKAVSATKLPPLPTKARPEIDVLFTFDYFLMDSSTPGYDIVSRWQRRVRDFNTADNHVGLGQAYANVKMYQQAEQEYAKAVEMKPDNLYYKRLLNDVTKRLESRTELAPP
jgi:TonB family protein